MDAQEGVWRAIGRSWMSLKTWVKVWLFYLNIVFLCSIPLYGQDPSVLWILVAYIASGPFLLAFMASQRGLSRLLGLAHIVPWTPLLAYLCTRLWSDGALGPQITFESQPLLFAYVLLLIDTVLICLAFDYIDVLRWLRGEKYLMGSSQAFSRNASGLA
ncbi:hypothetical protein [Allohahella sp. A8]|uniref:hypothetical protein n=1 Tax=Allohahella sp. A8 TaxID=3141461 RepID=UPI003A800BFF